MNPVRIYGKHKSGTSFLVTFFTHLSRLTKRKFYSHNNNPPDTHLYKALEGEILGVLRDETLIKPIINEKIIIQVRNPFDTLISEYYSYGWSHIEPSKDDPFYLPFMKRRERIQTMTLDEYCTDDATTDDLLKKYNELNDFIKDNYKNLYVSSYKHMTLDFEIWNNEICEFLNVEEIHKQKLYDMFHKEFDKFEPIPDREIFENKHDYLKAHRRDGREGQWKTKLNEKTKEYLETKFRNISPVLK